MNTNEKFIFLDIDGCLTCKEDGSSFLCMNDKTYGLSENCVKRLLEIIRKTGCKIVISSNWRRFPDDGEWIHGNLRFRNHLPQLKRILGDSYVGDLPHDRYVNKSEALHLWLEDNDVDDLRTIKFVVIDDDLSEGFASDPMFCSNFVLCNGETGLTDEQSENIVLFMNGVKKTLEVD